MLNIATLSVHILRVKLKVGRASMESLGCPSINNWDNNYLSQELQEHQRSDATRCGLKRSQLLDDTYEPPKKCGRCHNCQRQTGKNHCQVLWQTRLSADRRNAFLGSWHFYVFIWSSGHWIEGFIRTFSGIIIVGLIMTYLCNLQITWWF